jgi:hypothetical protein
MPLAAKCPQPWIPLEAAERKSWCRPLCSGPSNVLLFCLASHIVKGSHVWMAQCHHTGLLLTCCVLLMGLKPIVLMDLLLEEGASCLLSPPTPQLRQGHHHLVIWTLPDSFGDFWKTDKLWWVPWGATGVTLHWDGERNTRAFGSNNLSSISF